LAKSRKNAKLDQTLERKEAIKMEQGILVSVETFSAEEHKRKLEEDARLVALVGNDFEEILDNVVLESLKTLPTKEVIRKNDEKATMMDIDCDPVPKVVVVESI